MKLNCQGQGDSRYAGKMSKRAAEVQLTADTVEVDEEEEVRDLHACTTTCKLHKLDVCAESVSLEVNCHIESGGCDVVVTCETTAMQCTHNVTLCWSLVQYSYPTSKWEAHHTHQG